MVASTDTWIGIDVGSRSLDVSIGSRGESWQVTNDTAGFRALLIKLHHVPVAGIICEATGSYHHDLACALWDVGLPLTIVNPAWIKAWRGHAGKYAKTDAADARLLADYGEYHQPEPSRIPSKEERTLKALLSARTDLLKELQATQNRRRTAKEPVVRASFDRLIPMMKQECTLLLSEMEAIIAASPDLSTRRELLMTMPGVGKITSITLLIFLPELGTLKRREIAALAGLAPIANDSGTLSGKRWVHRGRHDVRRAMYMAAWASGKHPALISRKQRLRAKGKPAKVVTTAMARWMVTMLNVMLRDGIAWDQLAQAHRVVEVAPTK